MHHHSLDPDKIDPSHIAPAPESPELLGSWSDLVELISRLPPLEQDILQLIVISRKTHHEIGLCLGLSQQAVTSRYHRAIERIRAMRLLPLIDLDTLISDCARHLPDIDPNHLEIAHATYVSTKQSHAARHFGIAQQRVRDIYFDLIKRLESNPNTAHYGEALATIPRLRLWRVLTEEPSARRGQGQGQNRPARLDVIETDPSDLGLGAEPLDQDDLNDLLGDHDD